MKRAPTQDEILEIARRVCTAEQLEAIELYETDGGSYRVVQRRLQIGLTTVRDRIDRGMQRVMIEWNRPEE